MKKTGKNAALAPPAPLIAGVIVDGLDRGVARRALNSGAGLLELRIDTFRNRSVGPLAEEVRGLKSRGWAADVPLIITVRSSAEGGKFSMGDKRRKEIFTALMEWADYIDIELSSAAAFKDVISTARRKGKQVILSYHNFASTPTSGALAKLVKRARGAGADIVKIAAAVKTPGELKRLCSLLGEHKNLIVIAMGRFGRSSRVFFPILGSLMTYGSVTESTAPGQLSVRTIKKEFELYGIE